MRFYALRWHKIMVSRSACSVELDSKIFGKALGMFYNFSCNKTPKLSDTHLDEICTDTYRISF